MDVSSFCRNFLGSVSLLKMSGDLYSERPLFGGAISSTFPHRFEVSMVIVNHIIVTKFSMFGCACKL